MTDEHTTENTTEETTEVSSTGSGTTEHHEESKNGEKVVDETHSSSD